MKALILSTGLAMVLVAATSRAPPITLLSRSAKDGPAGNLGGLLLKNLPAPLYQKENNWGHQSTVRRRHLAGRFGDAHIEIMHEPRNDGVWKRLRVDAVNPN